MKVSLTQVVEDMIGKRSRDFSTCTIAKVEAIGEDKRSVDCRSLILERDDQGNEYPAALIYQAPIVMIGSKEVNISVNVEIGDIGIVLCATSETDAWNDAGRETEVVARTPERTSYSNPLFIPISVDVVLDDALTLNAHAKTIVIKNDESSMKAELDRIYDLIDGYFTKVIQHLTAIVPVNPLGGGAFSAWLADTQALQQQLATDKADVEKIFTAGGE